MMEPPYAGRHVRWCERSHGELIPMLLLDYPFRLNFDNFDNFDNFEKTYI